MTTETNTEDRPPLVVPVVHLNGTGRQALLRQLSEVGVAIAKAADKLREAAPNGRDYYPAGPEAMTAAVAQFERRLGVLRGLQDELRAEMAAIETAGR